VIDPSYSDIKEMKRQNLVRPSFRPSGDEKKMTGDNLKYDIECKVCGGTAFEEILEITRIEIEDGVKYECKYRVRQIVCMADGRKLAYSKFKLSEISKSKHKDNCCPVIRDEEMIDAKEYCERDFRREYLRREEKIEEEKKTRGVGRGTGKGKNSGKNSGKNKEKKKA
jgi:hypothetical protein